MITIHPVFPMQRLYLCRYPLSCLIQLYLSLGWSPPAVEYAPGHPFFGCGKKLLMIQWRSTFLSFFSSFSARILIDYFLTLIFVINPPQTGFFLYYCLEAILIKVSTDLLLTNPMVIFLSLPFSVFQQKLTNFFLLKQFSLSSSKTRHSYLFAPIFTYFLLFLPIYFLWLPLVSFALSLIFLEGLRVQSWASSVFLHTFFLRELSSLMTLNTIYMLMTHMYYL